MATKNERVAQHRVELGMDLQAIGRDLYRAGKALAGEGATDVVDVVDTGRIAKRWREAQDAARRAGIPLGVTA